MSDQVIDFPGGPVDDHIITDQPMRLRWGDWRTQRIIQVHVGAAAAYEDYRDECLAKGVSPGGQMPVHFSLDEGLHDTGLALLRHRKSAEMQTEVVYLSALMEALVNTPSAILRTDLIRRVYREVETLSGKLGLKWRGQTGRFMLPLNEDAMHPDKFERAVAPLTNLQSFFGVIREIAAERYQALAKNYVFYYPRNTGPYMK